MNIIISSAHYHLSDKYGSETIWGVEIMNHYARLGHNIYAFAGVTELEKPLEKNIQLYRMGNSRNNNPLIEVLKKFLYPFLSFIFSWYVFVKLKGNVSFVHHIAPISPVSYDLFFLIRPITNVPFILGPAMVPPQNNNVNDFGTVLGTNKSSFVTLLWIIYQLTLPILTFLATLTFKMSRFVIAVTIEGKKYYDTFLPSDKVMVVPVGVSEKFLNVIKKHRLDKRITIITASRLTERKGLDIIIRSFALVYENNPNVCLKVLGTGEQYDELLALVADLKLKKVVEFVGFVSNSEMPSYYSEADIFVTATRHEPFGMSIIEAMACGLPVLSSDVNALKDIIGDGGLTVQKDDLQNFANKLELLVQKKNLRERLGSCARKRVQNNFTWEKIVEKYIEIVKKSS